MKMIIILCFTALCSIQNSLLGIIVQKRPIDENNVVISTKRIHIHGYSGAYNPSIVNFGEYYLMTFRYPPNRYSQPWISHIGVVLLDKSFELVSEVELLNTRYWNKGIPSQSEDARIFSCNGRFYIIYNDNMDLTAPSIYDRRDVYIAELLFDEKHFFLSNPIKLIHKEYSHILWQKNWNPFEWNGMLLLSYSINPHEVITPDLETGNCKRLHQTKKDIDWHLGTLRGGTPANLIDGEYLAFFHSGTIMSSPFSDNRNLWHYFMGAYTFSADPPFELSKISTAYIDSPGFYTYSAYEKRVIYPGGYVVEDNHLYLAYGKDDSEIWIATLDLTELKNSLVPVKEAASSGGK